MLVHIVQHHHHRGERHACGGLPAVLEEVVYVFDNTMPDTEFSEQTMLHA